MEVSGHSLFLLQQLNVQREFGFLCDCTVAIGNVYFKAHRAVLAAFSNYFKMIFIHQSSECIKIQPTDIQPDVFSYLLHIMYTGTGPKQQVEPGRLQEGIKFLHAYQLRRTPSDGNQDTAAIAQDALRMSNLYGIQISSQSAAKEGPVQKGASVRGVGGARGERPRGCVQPAPSTAPELRRVSSVACGEDPVAAVTVKQEQVETEVSGERAVPGTGVAGMGAGPRCSPAPKSLSPVGRDGGDTPRETLCGHFLARAESASKGEEPEEELEGSGDRLLGGGGRSPSSRESEAGSAGLEEALRQSRALAEELAAELRGGGVGGVGGCSPRSRKRRMACAVCGLRFAHKAQLQEHAHSHAGTRGTRYHRYSRLCSQLIQASQHLCDSQAGLAAETSPRDVPDNSSSCYSLDSEVSQESIDTFAVE